MDLTYIITSAVASVALFGGIGFLVLRTRGLGLVGFLLGLLGPIGLFGALIVYTLRPRITPTRAQRVAKRKAEDEAIRARIRNSLTVA